MGMAQYGRIERGETDARLTTLVRIARGFGMPPVELLDGIE
jgi:transcriptional regulator with XRE-family HTH domain